MVIKLNLPNIDTKLATDELEKSKLQGCQLKGDRQKLVDPKTNGAAFEIHITDRLTQYGLQTFQPFFKHKIHCNVVRIRNIRPDLGVAHYMPHFDHGRTIGLNFCIDPGGTNVTTTFYDEDGGFKFRSPSYYKPWSAVTNPQSHQLNQQEWVGIDTNRYHSVNNIENERILFTISFFDISMSVFKKQYQNLIL